MGNVLTDNKKPRCQRCGSQWHTDCFDTDEFDTDENKEPFNGRLLVLAIIVSWLIFIGIVMGARELWKLIFGG
jgi:hypothetical protein